MDRGEVGRWSGKSLDDIDVNGKYTILTLNFQADPAMLRAGPCTVQFILNLCCSNWAES